MTFAAFIPSTVSRFHPSAREAPKTAMKLGTTLKMQQEFLISKTGIESSSSQEFLMSNTNPATYPSQEFLISATTTASSRSQEFEPVLPDATALAGFGAVLLVSAVAAWVWANQVVPTSRTKLAISKRRGDVKEYLDELEQPGNDRQFEQWLFTDWLEARNATAIPGRQKEPALPVLKEAKWNSGDNPILAATALILMGVIFTSVSERIFS